MSACSRRVLVGGLLAAVVVSAAAAGAVNAAVRKTNRVTPVVAARVDAYKGYYVGVSGHAVHRARVYVFIDEQACAADPSAEYNINHAPGQAWTVHGAFTRKSGPWSSSYRGTLRLCVYLQDASQPAYAATGVLRRASKRYQEICPAHSSPITSSEGVPTCSVPH